MEGADAETRGTEDFPKQNPAKQANWQLGHPDNVLPGIVPLPTKLPVVKRWNVETAAPRSGINSVAFSPDGKLIACGTDFGQVYIYDAETLELVQLVDEVAELQVQQVQLLTELIKNHGVEQVHLEGFCIGHEASFERILGEWTETDQRLVELRADVADFGDDKRAKPIAASIKQLEDELKLQKAHYGAAAQLWQAGVLETVLPCEDEMLLDAAKPIADDGTYREDAEAIEAREDFIVRTLLESGPVSYVILGGSHELAENVERLSGGKAEYLRVELEAWREFTEP